MYAGTAIRPFRSLAFGVSCSAPPESAGWYGAGEPESVPPEQVDEKSHEMEMSLAGEAGGKGGGEGGGGDGGGDGGGGDGCGGDGGGKGGGEGGGHCFTWQRYPATTARSAGANFHSSQYPWPACVSKPLHSKESALPASSWLDPHRSRHAENVFPLEYTRPTH